MNWYNKFIKISTRNKLDVDSIQICQKLFSDFRSLNNGLPINKVFSYSLMDILDETKIKKYGTTKIFINMSVELYAGKSLLYGNFDIGGLTLDYGEIGQNVELSIKISNNFNQNDFKSFYMLLFSVVRHEVQHVYDNLKDKPEEKVNFSYSDLVGKIGAISKEILSDRELNPYIRGFMLRSKRERRSFVDVVTEYVNMSFYGKDKNILMGYPVYSELKKIEDKTIFKIIEEAKKIYGKVF